MWCVEGCRRAAGGGRGPGGNDFVRAVPGPGRLKPGTRLEWRPSRLAVRYGACVGFTRGNSMDPRTEKMLAERERKVASMSPLLRRPVRCLNDSRGWVQAHRLAVKAGAAAAVLVLLAAYHLLVARPAERFEQSQLEARAAERIRTEASSRQLAVDDCLSKAAADAEAQWKAACKARGERAGCALTARQNQELQRKGSEARNTCLMKFSVTAQ